MLNKKKSSDLPPKKEEANNIDRHFNRHLADLEAEPPPNGWENINAQRTAKASGKGKILDLKVVPWRKYIAVAAAVAMFVVAITLSIPSEKEINSSSVPVIAERLTDKPIESIIEVPTEQHPITEATPTLPEVVNITAEKNIRPTCTNVFTLRKVTGKPIEADSLLFRTEVKVQVPEMALIQSLSQINNSSIESELVEQPIAVQNQPVKNLPPNNTMTENHVKKYPTVWAFITDKAIKHIGIKTETDPKAQKQTFEWNTEWLSIRHTQTKNNNNNK